MAEEQTDWLSAINAQVEEKARELEQILNCKVIPLVYVVNYDEQDVAVAYFRYPDAVQSLKIFRMLAENYENGIVMLVRSQLIREVHGYEGTASDSRFMTVDGNYQPEYSALNSTLLLDAEQRLITVYRDVFKKK